MNFTIQTIKFYVRETKPARFASALGKAGQAGKKPERVTSPLCHVRMVIKDLQGNTSFGCSADRLSVRWLDKRPGRSKALKLRELVSLIQHAREIYLAEPTFESAFGKWLDCHRQVMAKGRESNQENLTSSFASALLERAVIDGVCRLAGNSFFQMLSGDGLGFQPATVNEDLKGLRIADWLPEKPRTTINVRHTIGLFDPLTDEDWPADKRLNDGLPETVEEHIRQEGLRFFKIKISGNVKQDLARLARIWEILPHEKEPVVTLDANEAFDDLKVFSQFVTRLEREQLGIFQHIAFIEQPLRRDIALDMKAAKWIRRIGRAKPVIIDESDDSLDAFQRARAIGYAGTSHKNCKGVFKSLINRAWASHLALQGSDVLMSAEDLQNLPIVPLHQDFVSVGALGISHCERNGHHYNFGLSMFSENDKASVARHHRDLYERRGNEWFLKIHNGAVNCASLQCVGFGVRDEPDWKSMEDMSQWLRTRYPA